MSVRRFNGTSDELRCSIGGSNLTGAFTIAVLARPQAADEGTFISLWDATTERVAFGVNGSKQPRLKIGATALSGAEIEVTPTTSQWGIWVVTKEAGTKNPRWHHYGFDTGVWKHANDGSTIGDPVTQAGGTVRFGNGTTLGFEQADLAAPAVWTKALSDAEVEALKSAVSIIGGWKPSASGLWLFKQSSVTEEVTDSTGNGANQSARTGTTALGEEPPISYEGKTVEGKAAGTGTGSGSAKGTRERLGKGAGSGTGSGSASGTRTRLGKGAGSGSGSGEAKGTRTRLGKGDGTGTGTGAAAGTRTRLGKGDGSGAGSGQAKGTRTRLGKAAGTGTGSGSAKGSIVVPRLTPAELQAAAVLDSLIRKPAEALYGKDWHGTFAEPGEGTPTGWTVIGSDEYATARWWRYGFPAPAFAGLTFAESLGEGQFLAIALGDNKLGNAVVLKLFWNNPEEYFYALYEQIGGEEVEPEIASGFIPRVKGDRFYLSVEDGEGGICAWRETGGGEPEVFAEGTLTEPLEVYGASADLILQGAGAFRGTEFTAVSLNPEPPIEEKPAGKMVVALQAQDWGGITAEDIAGAVHTARLDSEDSLEFLEELLAAGLKITCVFAGPYNEGGVSALDPDEWVANALAFYEAHLTPTQAPIVEILNEPHGPWFWGEEAGNAANAVAYRTLIKKAYEAFHAKYGSEAPKIIASVEGLNGIEFGEKWWEPAMAAYLDGVVVHAYGGNNPEKKAASAEGHRDHVEEARLLTGESLPVYVTEVGWPTAIKEEPTGDSLQWTETEQAANLTSFFNWARATGYIAEVAYFGYHDYDFKTWYGVVDLEGKHKPSYAALQAQAFGPEVFTLPATGINPVKATLNGTVNPNGLPTTYYFEYGTTEAYGSKTAVQEAGEGSEAVAISEAIAGLKPNATYHFRLVAVNAEGESVGEDATFTTEAPIRVAVTREFPPDRLAVRIADPTTGQTIARWAEDEGKPENTIAGLTKSGEMSGGHKESGGSLPRDPRVDWPDTETYFDYYLEQPGGENVFEGRINGAPESDGDRMVLEPKAVGHQAALTDRTALRMGFIDGDQGKWGDPSTARRLALIEAKADLVASTSVGFSSKDPEASKPAVINDFTGAVNQKERIEIGEADYYSGGVDIAGLLYDYVQLTSFSEDANWTSKAALSQTDSFSTYQGGTDHNRTTALQQGLYATVQGLQYALVEDYLADEGEGPLYDITSWQNLKVLSWIAAQNLALQGTWPDVGYTAKQILELAVPLFSYLEAQDEDLEDDGYVIQQAWYSDPGDLATVVKDVLKYGVLRWFVLNGKRFELRAPGTFGCNWQAYAGPSELKEAGIDGSRCWDRQVVSFRDVDGSTRTVGYPGSGADYESPQLQITDPDHPAVKAERPREDLLTLGISAWERALEAGERWLQEGNELSHAGEATLRGYIQDDCAVFRPVSQIQPGDRIRFPDAGSGGTGYREVVEVSYDHESRTATVQLDAPSKAVQALLERYGAADSSLALS